jgi:phosphatidylserine/phosphatidylglycerophosphate/cardiolipin synthase-like enzyme
VIQRHISEFQKPRVLTIRPGYEVVGGKLTRVPAIVVTVRNKVDSVPAGQSLPTQLEGIPVDVRQASMLDLLRADDPQRYAAFLASARAEMVPPLFPYEREVASALPLAASFGPTALAATAPAKQKLPYTPAPNANLKSVSAPMALTLNVSPDAGWMTLKNFFASIQARLTVGMYDFTARHILDELLAQLQRAGAPLTLTLDHPAKNPTADQSDEETEADLAQTLRQKFSFAWALERMDPKVSAYIYNSAYHIKVAVSDGVRMWISSGNWNNSNQPEIDTSGGANAKVNSIAKKSDRDWHVVVDHSGLSSTFEKFLKHDYQVASQQLAGAAVLAAAVGQVAAGTLTDDEMSELKAGTRTIKVQPLLTPDPGVYTGKVLKLIQSAQRTFYMQTQYIHPSDNAADQGLTNLINAVIRLQKRGVDVRIILSQWQVQNDKNHNPVWWERLQQAGIDLSAVKIQSGVHNKGIVVDSKTVMVSSQNWSGDGVLRNRDAGLIIYDEEVAQYYEQVFLHDWQYMAQAGPLDVSIDSRAALVPGFPHGRTRQKK